MKKIIAVSMVLLIFLVTGCSVDIDTGSSSKIDSVANKLEAKAEALQVEFDKAMDMADELEGKKSLTAHDQKRIANQIENVLSIIDEFKEVKTPVIGKKVKEIGGENLENREEILLNVQERAEKGIATKSDVRKMKKALSDDINIKLFN